MNVNPLIVQGDLTVLVDVSSPRYVEARDAIAPFAELVKSPEHIHTYRISPLSIWNACAAGVPIADILGALNEYARYPVPAHVITQVRDFAQRFGRVRIERDDQDPAASHLLVHTSDAVLAEELAHGRQLAPLLADRVAPTVFRIRNTVRGRIKQALIKAGFPAEDVAGYAVGEALAVLLRTRTRSNALFALRDYQVDAVNAFHLQGAERGGSPADGHDFRASGSDAKCSHRHDQEAANRRGVSGGFDGARGGEAGADEGAICGPRGHRGSVGRRGRCVASSYWPMRCRSLSTRLPSVNDSEPFESLAMSLRVRDLAASRLIGGGLPDRQPELRIAA